MSLIVSNNFFEYKIKLEEVRQLIHFIARKVRKINKFRKIFKGEETFIMQSFVANIEIKFPNFLIDSSEGNINDDTFATYLPIFPT